ncbi:MAG: hypothetical protein LC122_11665 [Chitinophagales bacterium]|nr:hypothetical protein [Chitinophagales bacterium]
MKKIIVAENELLHAIWKRINNNAKISKSLVEVDKKTCYDLLVKQNFKCALSGLDIIVAKTYKDFMLNKTTASLDRIDSNGNYAIDNIQWVHKDINFIKQNFNQKYFIELCKKISDYNE